MLQPPPPPPPPAAYAPPPPPAPPPVARKRRRGLIALVVALLVIALVSAGLFVTHPWAPDAAASSQTIWGAITDKIRNGQPSKDVALEAFAYLYKVNIPGVHVPAGADTNAPTEGTMVSNWVQANWDQLTADQQAIINPYLEPGPNDTTITYDRVTGHETGRARGAANEAWVLGNPFLAAFVAPRIAPTREHDAPSDALVQAFHDEVMADIGRIGPKLGMTPISEGIKPWKNVTLTFSAINGGNTLYTTYAREGGPLDPYTPCNITVWNQSWANLPPSGGKLPDATHVLVTHEVVHCFQNVIWGSLPVALSMPEWITEGTALFLAEDDTKILESMVHSQWVDGWFGDPEKALTNRTYDGYAYYSLLTHLGRNMWNLAVPAWQAAAASPSGARSDPFIAVLNGDADDVRQAWATSLLRQAGWLDPWITYGDGLTDDAQVLRHPIEAVDDPGWLGSLDSRSATVDSVGGSAGEVVIVQTDGLASAHDEAGHSQIAFTSQRFCVSGTCVCPPKTAHEGEHMADADMAMPFVLAFNAPEGGSHYRVLGKSLEDLCGPEQPDDQNPFPGGGGGGGGGGSDNPCGSGCAGSNGDPHMVTVSGAYYDFQAAGEYTLLRSPDGALDVQARQEPFEDSDKVAINTAIAARVAGHRVGVYFADGTLTVHVDGKPTDVSTPLDLGDGAHVSQHARGIEIQAPDGTQIWALSLGHYGINVQIRPSAGLRRNGVGILGPVLPGGLGVPKLPDGTRLPRASNADQRYQALYGKFGPAWRVSDGNTLFDYDAGKSTASYSQPGFPNPAGDATIHDLTPTQRNAAAPACVDAIADPLLYQQCLFDVTATDDPGFGDVYRIIIQLFEQGAFTLDEPPTGGGPPPTSPPPGGGPSATPGPQPVGAVLTGVRLIRGWTVAPDGTLYLSILYPGDKTEIDAIDPGQGKVIRRTDAKGSGALAFAAGSLWAAEFDGDLDCSVSRLDPQTFAVQATIDTGCDIFGTTIVASGDSVWWIDRSLNSYNNVGVRRIDPATNASGDPVQLPFFNGYLQGTPQALVYGDTGADKGWYRLPTGSTTLQSLGQRSSPIYAVDGGLWNQDQNQTANYFTSDGAPTQSIDFDGVLVGADDQAIYVDLSVAEGSQLWRYPVDGGDPVVIGHSPPDYGDESFYYADNAPFIATGSSVVKVWLMNGTDTSPSAVFVQLLPTSP